MHSLQVIIYANEQAAQRAKARALKKRLAEAPKKIADIIGRSKTPSGIERPEV